jgi:flagellar protein FlgJ
MLAQADISGGLAASAQSLDKLRAQAKQSPEAALKATAKQFEAVFLGMMLKSMRQATPQDGVLDNEQTKMFTDMLDQQMAQNMANRGIGLADMIYKQLSRNAGSTVHPPAPGKAAAASQSGASATSTSSPTAQAKVSNALPSAYSESFQQGFVQRMTPYALEASSQTGVSAPLMMGQAALESGWGQREIRLPDGSNSYNLFGIKAGSGWNGKVATVTTTEYHNGVASKQVEKFRAYGSYAEAFSDYARMLSNNPRYAPVVQTGQSAPASAVALQHAGYATDPNYADKLVKVMNKIHTLRG